MFYLPWVRCVPPQATRARGVSVGAFVISTDGTAPRRGSWWSDYLVPGLQWFSSKGAEERVFLIEADMASGSIEQPGPSPGATTTCRLSDVSWSVFEFGGACMDLPFTVLYSTPRHGRHIWLHSADDVLNIPKIFTMVST
ncbi:hypothetical protein AHAS_Ahas02G0096200 [Arachis hypogaea]